MPLAQGLILKGGSQTWVPVMPLHLSRTTLRASLREQCEEKEKLLCITLFLAIPSPFTRCRVTNLMNEGSHPLTSLISPRALVTQRYD